MGRRVALRTGLTSVFTREGITSGGVVESLLRGCPANQGKTGSVMVGVTADTFFACASVAASHAGVPAGLRIEARADVEVTVEAVEAGLADR